MSSVLADTNALYWHLFEPDQLSTDAQNALQTADATAGLHIYVSVITLIEILYLVEKHKFPAVVWTNTLAQIQDPATALELLPIDEAIATSMHHIPRAIVPDLPDRIIATTAHVHQLPLVTSDQQIQKAPITVIW